MMKKEYVNVIIPIITAVLGIGIGYFVFSALNLNAEEDHKKQGQEEMEHQIWTCSMHPQIRQNEPGDCPLCGMDLIPADDSENDNPLILSMTEEAVKLSQIQTTIIGGNQMNSLNLNVSGKIEANETTSASLVTHIPGRIEKLYVSFTGELVSKGQKIALIYSPALITAQKELIEANKIKVQQPKLYEAAYNKLKYWKITDKQIDEILNSGEIQENFLIYADHSGVVQQRKVSVGDHLNQGGVLFSIQNLNNLWVVFDVYEKDLSRVNLGSEVVFSTTSLPQEKFNSVVSFIDPIIDPSTRTAKIRVEISNKGNMLKPDMFVSGEIRSEYESEMNITVPKSAVMWTGQRSVVYVQLPEMNIPSFEYREVLLGQSLGDSYQLIEGLEVGEEVVTNGAFVIDASAQLNNQASMMNRLIPGAQEDSYLPDYTSESPIEFKMQLEKLSDKYLELKEAFVLSDPSLAMIAATDLKSEANNVDMSLLKGEAHLYWMELESEIQLWSDHIGNESDLKTQRTYFTDLSAAIVTAVKTFGTFKMTYYVQFCPMANDKEGGYWLSAESQIRNPYFGDKMLGCGEVKNEIDKDFKNKVKVNQNKSQSGGAHNH